MSEIFWIGTKPRVPLAVVLCPSGDDSLKNDLDELKQGGIETLVSLLEEDEAAWLGLSREGSIASKVGLKFLSHPIPDANIPMNPAAFRVFHYGARRSARCRRAHWRTLPRQHWQVHCYGGVCTYPSWDGLPPPRWPPLKRRAAARFQTPLNKSAGFSITGQCRECSDPFHNRRPQLSAPVAGRDPSCAPHHPPRAALRLSCAHAEEVERGALEVLIRPRRRRTAVSRHVRPGFPRSRGSNRPLVQSRIRKKSVPSPAAMRTSSTPPRPSGSP